MVTPIPKSVREIWKEWNIRGIILFSLALQAFLIMVAPFRKRTSNKFFIFLLWMSYLLADWAASFTVGHISSKQNDDSGRDKGCYANNKADDIIQAFWAPFLLLHLGGPDTITAFSLEDNELWLRHLLALVTQVLATAYVFIQTVPGNILWKPTIVMFIGGIIKYVERTRALYKASLSTFRASLLEKTPNYAEYTSKAFSKDVVQGHLKEIEIVNLAHYYFQIFKGLIVDSILSIEERDESRKFFMSRTATDAYRVMGVELNFIYEVLYTKVQVVHNTVGYVFRFLAFASIFATLVLFYFVDKDDFKAFDVRTTYTLLLGAIFLDAIALFNLIFSDWSVVGMYKYSKIRKSCVSRMLEWLLKLQEPNLHNSGSNLFNRRIRATLFGRWSEVISGYNFITYSLRERFDDIEIDQDHVECCWNGVLINKIKYAYGKVTKCFTKISNIMIDILGLTGIVNELKYTIGYRMNEHLWNFIFKELQDKAKDAEDVKMAKRICEAKGSYVLLKGMKDNEEEIKELVPYIDEVSYDKSLVLWHIATELCYQNDFISNELDPMKDDKYNNQLYHFSKLLSDYMLYLLVLQPTMMSAVIAGVGQIRFWDMKEEIKESFVHTSEEAKRFFSRRGNGKGKEKEACMDILAVNTTIKPATVKGDRSKSVLFDACVLAKKLDQFGDKKWEILSSFWVEMLSYAASHCRPDSHAQLVSKGGELITFVWLLMAHLGLGDQYQKEGLVRADLVVRKEGHCSCFF
ncbi:uncharacterized protein LOC115722069 isoform X1 [Cannabis sativa]|uniref:uncharacterized protein LOC115722069 isoform X1 n=2 Tax=Cannabis sativa TaxID=3483 RepID=UPI0029CA5204|nr:uncharacterized protein LOC115722069 isoform X1 [Cannabis sativa]